jgi:hypothetical protein
MARFSSICLSLGCTVNPRDVDEGVAEAGEHLRADRGVRRGVLGAVGAAGLCRRRLQTGVALDVGARVRRVGRLGLGFLQRRLGLDEDPLELLLVVAQHHARHPRP